LSTAYVKFLCALNDLDEEHDEVLSGGINHTDLTAEPNNYNSPVSKAASLMDNCTFYRFSKICELFPSLIDYFSLLSFTFITLILIFLSYGYQVKI